MKITIYTTSDCQFSKAEKEYLTSHNLPYEEKNLEQNRDWLTEMLAVSNNFAGTPVTKIEKDDGQIVVLKGFTQEEFDKVLNLSPSPSPTPPTPTSSAPTTEQPTPETTQPPTTTPPTNQPVTAQPETVVPPTTSTQPPNNPPAENNDPLTSILNDLQEKATPTDNNQPPPPNIPDFPKNT